MSTDLTPPNDDLVFMGEDGEPFTTSLVIAAETGNEHASVLRLIRDNLDDLNEVGLVRFEIRPRLEGQHGGGAVEFAVLDELAAALLMTYLRNTPKVKEFKKRLVVGFYTMRQLLMQSQPALPANREERLALAVLDAQQMITERDEQLALAKGENRLLAAAIERDAPLVAKAEAHTANAKAINRQTFAREVQGWGLKQNINILHEQVYEMLRRKGMLIDGHRSDRNHATAHAVKSGWAWTHKDVTEEGYPTAVTMINPRGQDVAWKWITEYVHSTGSLVLPPKITGGAA